MHRSRLQGKHLVTLVAYSDSESSIAGASSSSLSWFLDWYAASCEVEVGPESTTALSASRKGSGSVLPRFSARRRIPAQASGLKKNRCGTGPVSKTSDNEHTLASLGHTEVLSVKHPVGDTIPELPQSGEELAESICSV